MEAQVLEKAKALRAAVDQAQSSLRKMEEKRDQVKASVFQKVRAEYDAKLQSARAELEAIVPQVQARAQELTRAAAEASRRLDECAEQEDEVALRHHIGEIADEDYSRRTVEIRKRRDSAHAEQERCQGELGAIMAVFRDDPAFAALAVAGPARPEGAPATQPAIPVQPAPAAAPPPPPPAPAPPAAAAKAATPPPTPPPPAPGPTPSRAQIESALGDPFADVAAGGGPGGKVSFSHPHLIVKAKGGEEDSYMLDLGEFTIGRSTDNDIVIDEDGVSAKHAVVRFERDHYMVQTLGSDGLTLNGKATKKATLQDGDILRVGKVEITFRNVRWEA